MGRQEPSVRITPDYEYTDGGDAVKILHAGKVRPDEWQINVLNDWLGRSEEEVWSSPTCGLSVPRQNGKTLDTSGRIIAGMILYGEWCVYTSHLQKTSTETFQEIRGILETPKLSKRVKEVRAAVGREQILLTNGARVVFVARTRNGGRGLHGDLLVFDEAQELNSDQQASFLPAISASRNPQTIYLGTPPAPLSDGGVFRKIRKQALSGDSKAIAWTEFSVDEIGDISDKARWAATNPALGRRIRETTIASEYEQMDPDTFARERLGWWSPEETHELDYAIDKNAWIACKTEKPKPEGKTAFGVKFSPDGSEVCLSGAVIPTDSPARIEIIARRPTSAGTQWLADWLNERYKSASCVVIDGRNGVDLLCDRLAPVWKYKASVIRARSSDVIAAASLLVNDVNEQTVEWRDTETALSDSALTAIKRPIGAGWGFGGDDSTPIEAAALALWGAHTSKRNPSRVMRIG